MPIFSIHGIDASGKASQVKAVIAALHAAPWTRGLVISCFDFPRYQSTIGAIIGRVLRGETLVVPAAEVLRWTSDVLDERDAKQPGESYSYSTNDRLAKSWTLDKGYLIQAAMVVNRLEFLPMLVQGAHDEQILVLDRYILDAMVYGQVDGLDRDWLVDVHAVLPPALVNIVLDIPVEESVWRRPERRDQYEKNLDKLARVAAMYRHEAQRGNRETNARFVVLDGCRDREVITNEIVELIHGEMDQLPPPIPFG